MNEFKQVIRLVPDRRTVAMMCLQYHMIGRMDDTAHVRKTNLKASGEFEDYLTCRMRWSKNVNTDRDCPEQILIGSMDAETCVLLNLALFLETWIGEGEGHLSQWLFADGSTTHSSPIAEQNKEATRAKTIYSRRITAALRNVAFEKHQAEGRLGSHSIRKLATTYSRNAGAQTSDINYRARWKDKSNRMQDRYTDIQLSWPDVFTATKLCVDGPCKYKMREDAGVSDEWLATNVTPNIRTCWDPRIAAILARPLLWACFDESWSIAVDASTRASIINRFNNAPRDEPFSDGVNPVEKIGLTAEQGRLYRQTSIDR
jgi:hypothetical protein